MPELPEVDALAHYLEEQTRGRIIDRCELAAFAALKTVEPPLESLVGRRVRAWRRRGKFLCLDAGGSWLVVHLARGGWIKWWDTLPESRARLTRGPLALRVGLDDGAGFDVTEMGTEKRLALWLVTDPTEIEGIRTLGVDPLDPEFSAETLGEALAGQSGTVKNALTRQSVIAGVGNAYSDEALHVARLSPFKAASRLDHDEVVRLHDALVLVLGEALARADGRRAVDLKDDKRKGMRVHGRTGLACPECGDVVREVSFSTKSLQYCATCQTGGKPLADRRLSRLIK